MQDRVRWSRGVRLHTSRGILEGWHVEVHPRGLQPLPKEHSGTALPIVPWSEVDSLEARLPEPPQGGEFAALAGWVGVIGAVSAVYGTPDDRDTGDAAGTAYVGSIAAGLTLGWLGLLATFRTQPWRTVHRRPTSEVQR